MNPFQFTQNLVYLLSGSRLVWPDAPGEPVLSRIVAAPPPPGYFRHDAVAPFGLIVPEASKDDEEHPADIVADQRWTVYLMAGNATEQAGASAIVGGSRRSLGSSRGRGLLEVEPLVRQKLFNNVGLIARLKTTGARVPSIPDELAGLVSSRAIEIEAAMMPALEAFSPVKRLLGQGAAGTVTLTWAAAPARYDLIGFTWARSAVAFPTDPTAGTFVANPAATGLVDTPGAGTWYYSIWWAYDVTRDPFSLIGVAPVAPNRWSSQRSSQAGLVYLPAQVQVAA